MYVNPGGKCHPEMTGIYSDELIPALADLVQSVHDQEGKIAVQINHGGGRCVPETIQHPISPSDQKDSIFDRPTKEMTTEEIQQTINDFAKAAYRVKEAGVDAVQIHGAHGYLVSQFLSPLTNSREDEWGGSHINRSKFLKEICLAVREQVGSDYPVIIKFGIADGHENGLSLKDGLDTLQQFESWGLDGIEISSGFSGELFSSIQTGIRKPEDEGYFLPFVEQARQKTDLPLIAVGGFRSRQVMERVLLAGTADFISLCRPLIRDPKLPALFEEGEIQQSDCLSATLCWAENIGEGISCKCPLDTD
jgi:2,4-dienoyl-CoA reductase-like NADH-dependent reductase (Old Yellow Enzyme family)